MNFKKITGCWYFSCTDDCTPESIIFTSRHKKNPLRLTIACLHKAFYFLCALTISIYWHAIAYVGMWTCGCVWLWIVGFSPGTPGILCLHYPVLYFHPPTNVLFICDTNINYVITFAIENIQTKACQCLFSNLWKLWRIV